ncbi:MAG: M23 family metallopeptidase [Pseudomonadota bacterium]
MRGWDLQRRNKPIELGDDAPLAIGEDDPSRYTRRGVSLRWLFGAVTTAITSLALMGGALVAALDGRYVINAQAAIAPFVAPEASKASKGDRVTPVIQEVSSRRVIEVSTVVRQGDEDLIAKRPYAVVSASLVLDQAKISDIPAFNARALAIATREGASEEGATDAIYDRAVDGEITVSVSSFPLDGAAVFDDALSFDETDVERQLREEGLAEGSALPFAEQDGFVDDRQARVSNVTLVPENMSELIKTTEDEDGDGSSSELIEVVQPGDTLKKILLGSGIVQSDVTAIRGILDRLGVARLKAGQTLRIAFRLDESGEDATRRPSRFSIYEKDAHVATVAMTDTGRFVLGEAPPGPAPVVTDVQVASSKGRLPAIYRSLYQTALDHELPESVRDSLLATFSLDVDFNAQVRPGDRLTVFYSETAEEGQPPEILFASLTAGGVERRFYRFKSPDGTVDFYDEDGRTGDKFLLRKPMARGVFRSGFGMRRHPILRRRRMHNGVDWAAPRGTRIYAAGDGVVKQAGWKAGYGRWVSIRHKNGYETGYAHQSRIAKGIRPGVRVKQGQIIGYVGSTGFSTGPHLHYEVRVNGRHVNPLKIRLRRGRELSGQTLVEFKAERDRIDRLIVAEEVPVASRT